MLFGHIPAYPPCAARTAMPLARAVSPGQAETFLSKGRFEVDAGVRYAWAKALDSDEKPVICASIDGVARHIQAERDQLTIEFEDGEYEPLQLGGAVLPVVTVYGGFDGQRTQLLGHAYIDGRPWEALQAALEAIERPARARVTPRRWKG